MAIHSVLIGGNRWEFRKLTPKLAVKFLRELKQNPKKVHLRGYCNTEDKKIYIQEKQHPEDITNTILHEGLPCEKTWTRTPCNGRWLPSGATLGGIRGTGNFFYNISANHGWSGNGNLTDCTVTG
jgi:hypothetical protein